MEKCLEKIFNQLIEEIKPNLNKKINDLNYFFQFNEDNQKIHNFLVEFIESNFKNIDEFDNFKCEIFDLIDIHKNELNENKNTDNYFFLLDNIYSLLDKYEFTFIENDYIKFDKEYKPDIIFNTLGNITYYLRKLDNEHIKSLIIIPNGETYLANFLHWDLCSWLTLEGIDLQNSIRVSVSKPYKELSFNSINNTNYIHSDKSKENFRITEQQAESLKNIYLKLSKYLKNFPSIEQILMKTQDFGFGYNDEDKSLARKNLLTLENAFGSSQFNSNEYLRMLKDANTFYDFRGF